MHVLFLCAYFTFCFVVPDPTPITGMQASVVPRNIVSSGSDVFICEEAGDTPAAESHAASVLADEGAHTSRTQHGRDAVGLEPSVVYNDLEKGIVECVCYFVDDRIFFTGRFVLLSNWVNNVWVTLTSSVCIFSGPESCFPWVAHDDVSCPVRDARPECCPS